MAIFYFDTSALVKRYVSETGDQWVRDLCDAQEAESEHMTNEIIISEITRVEFAATLAKKANKTREITQEDASDAYKLFLNHLETEYQIVPLTSNLVRFAAEIARKHTLRSLDAVQFATAVSANNLLSANGLSLHFITSDKTLLQAAQDEGLAADNPLNHVNVD